MTSTMDYKVFYKSPWGMAFIAYFVAMGLVGALTPPDILTAYGWTRPFTDFMASIVPQIDKVTALGIDADINRFYFSVMWAGSPVVFLLTVTSTWMTRQVHLVDPKSLWRLPFWKGFLWLIIAGLLSVYVLQNIAVDPQNPARIIRISFEYPTGRMIITQSLVLVPTFVSAGLFNFSVGWLTGYIPRNIRKQNETEATRGK
jgi:hypothetical protein